MPETCDESFELTLLQVIGAGSAIYFIQRLWRPVLLRLELRPIAGIDNGRGLVQSISIFAESCHIDRGVVLHRIGGRIAERDQQPGTEAPFWELVAALDRLFPGVKPVPHPADIEAAEQLHREMAAGIQNAPDKG